jgi:hypothetical protein
MIVGCSWFLCINVGTILALGRKRGELKIFWRMANQKDSAHMSDSNIVKNQVPNDIVL